MPQEQWTAVDRYFSDTLVQGDPVLEEALRASDAAGLPAINVADNQGKFLMLLALMRGALEQGFADMTAAVQQRAEALWIHRQTNAGGG